MVVSGETSRIGGIAIEHLRCSGDVLCVFGPKTLQSWVKKEEERLGKRFQVVEMVFQQKKMAETG